MSGERITVCEIFGPTIQGEGLLIGRPTIFVRTGGCDFRCSWCDTLFAVDPVHRPEWTAMTAEQILADIKILAGPRPLLVSLSGGNPALQPLGGLIDSGRREGYTFAVETQGSIAREWFAGLDFLTVSPKPPSSGMTVDRAGLEECLQAAGQASIQLKFVIADEDDYYFARRVAAWFPELPVSLQPCNDRPGSETPINPEKMYVQMRRLIERVVADGWYEARVLPQLHVLLWGNKRGY